MNNTTDRCFSETTPDVCHIYPRSCAAGSCGALLTMSAHHPPHSSSLRGRKNSSKHHQSDATSANFILGVIHHLHTNAWYLGSPSMLQSFLRSHFLTLRSSGTNKALTFFFIRCLTGFPYHLLDFHISTPRKTKAINSSAANTPPKIAMSRAEYTLSEGITAARKTNQSYKR